MQRLEYEAALEEGYTVQEWLRFEGSQYHLLDGSVNLSPRVRDDVWSMPAYASSVQHLHQLRPRSAYFTHDSTVWRAETRETEEA